jgi:5'-nucleotidase / UDP-sugar diphosphatase
MRGAIAIGALSLILAGAACSADASGSSEDEVVRDRHVIVLFTSDEHSHLFALGPELDDFPLATTPQEGQLVGGLARRAAVIARLRKEAAYAGKDSLLVSAGDNQMGCLPHLAFESASIDYGTMKSLGYDATTFGNHEFDFGPGALARSISAATAGNGLPPIIASNIHFSASDPADDALAALYSEDAADDKPIHPYRVIRTAHGIKVGLLGFVGINAAHVAPNKTPVAFSAPVNPQTDGDIATHLPRLYADLQPVVDKLRNEEHVDLVVALSHAGVQDSTTEAGILAGEDTQICQNVRGIDLIVSGHAHDEDPRPMKMTNKETQRPCLVLNGGSFGKEVGRVDFTIPYRSSDGVTWDERTQGLVPVDSKVVPDRVIASKMNGFVAQIESAGNKSGGSVLASLLSHALETSVVDDRDAIGELYFKPLARTTFDVTEDRPLTWLSADAMLAQADALRSSGLPGTDVGIESAGNIRASILRGKTGVIAAADAFNVVPLGRSPVDGTTGYPLVRGNLTRLELRAVLELALAFGAVNTDYALGAAGIKVDFDLTRPIVATPADLFDPSKGRVMRIALDSNHADGFEQYDRVIYDRAMPVGGDTSLVSVVTSSYIAQFAADAGVSLRNDVGQPLAIADAILKRNDASEVKQVEAFMRYLHAGSGSLSSVYDSKSGSFTKRWICRGGC